MDAGDGTATEREAVDRYIEEFKAAYVECLANGRFASLNGYLADDVVVLRPGHAAVEGKATWAAMVDEWGANTSSRYDATYTTHERVVSDGLVVERGVCHEGPIGADESEFRDFNYLWLLRRTGGSGWEVSHKAWNMIR